MDARSSPKTRHDDRPAPGATCVEIKRFVVSPEALQKYGQEADDGLLTSKILFKMKRPGSGLRGAAKTLDGAAADVALAIDCGAPSRVFRAAGKFEDAHVASRVEISDPETNRRDRTSAQVAAGLDLWYAVDCGSEPAPRGLARAAAAGERVDAVEPARARRGLDARRPALLEVGGGRDQPPGAWDATAGSPDVVVQVVDDGVDVDHPDLERNVWTNPGEVCGNGVDDDGNGYADDCHGYNHADDNTNLHNAGKDHGTHCAGTLAAEGGNGVGVAGVAGGKAPGTGVKLMVSISSNSWGYKQSNSYEQALLDAIDYANDKGSLVVFAAGNHAETEKRYPAAYAGAVAVAATDDGGAMASFSNHGGWVDIAAPVAVVSTIGGGRYAASSGTSMAAPHVAGVLALGASSTPPPAAADARRAPRLPLVDGPRRRRSTRSRKLGAGLVDAEAFVACAAGDDEDAARDAAAPRQLEIAGVMVRVSAASGATAKTSWKKLKC
ncbi:serine-type endopeptidase [Aureococcus anophagefferens]|nr:serine-type endopeptidase [Aureococcus anophagefferens]